MIWDGAVVHATILLVVLAMLMIGMGLAFVRLVIGPSTPDRIVALDLASVLAVGIIAVYDISEQQPIFLDAAIVLALISFLGTVAFAYYIEKGTAR